MLTNYLDAGFEKDDVLNILIPRVKAQIHSQKVLDLFGDDIKYYVNPTGKFVIGGPHGDTGLTGRKIIVDTYGGKGAHGGGAFSGKDSSKVDRSAAYAARHIAKNMVAAGISDEILVQVSYAIGVAKPMNIYVNTYGRGKVAMSDGEIAKKIEQLFDLRPKAIERTLKLRVSHRSSARLSLATTTRQRPSTWSSSPGRSWIVWTIFARLSDCRKGS